jgi:hypothetical protein
MKHWDKYRSQSSLRFILHLTPGSPGKFLMAAFVRVHAQKVTAEIYPVQPLVMHCSLAIGNGFSYNRGNSKLCNAPFFAVFGKKPL